jgi:hypothetical protein
MLQNDEKLSSLMNSATAQIKTLSPEDIDAQIESLETCNDEFEVFQILPRIAASFQALRSDTETVSKLIDKTRAALAKVLTMEDVINEVPELAEYAAFMKDSTKNDDCDREKLQNILVHYEDPEVHLDRNFWLASLIFLAL